jgi:6-phospho-3-hexuloisomerase
MMDNWIDKGREMTDEGYAKYIVESRELVLSETRMALESIDVGEVEAFIGTLTGAGSVFCLGVGRVALSIAALVKRLNHIGINAWMVGDLSEPCATENDLLVIASGSGESAIPASIAEVAHRKSVPIAYIGSNMNSRIAGLARVRVRIPVRTKLALSEEIPSEQIMSSLFEQSLLLFGDVVALAHSRKAGLDPHSLWRRHANLE